MNNDQQINEQIDTLADHLLGRRDSILKNWRHAVDEDPALTSASTLARKEFYDHIPAVLDAFDQMLRARYLSEKAEAAQEQKEHAAEHGLHRWHHGYNQRDVMREWSHLHIVLVNELENYSELSPGIESGGAMSVARRALAELCSNGVNESAMRYAELQQVEAAARIQDLEQALESLSELDRKRVETWRRAVHDVRGSFGVIKNIADQLHDEEADEVLKTEFLTLLQKSVSSLHGLLNNLLVLSRLEAGQEQRDVHPIDAAVILKELSESFQPLAAERGLFLRVQGPPSLLVQGDAINIQRIAQNLIWNALKYTRDGGVTIGWEALEKEGLRRWAFFVQDTGPGFQSGASGPLSRTIEASTLEAEAVEQSSRPAIDAQPVSTVAPHPTQRQAPPQPGEGIGLTIVKRLCELLDATLELTTEFGQGSVFRVIFPRTYDMP
jgi:signal transduction histidine kinase